MMDFGVAVVVNQNFILPLDPPTVISNRVTNREH